MSTRETLRGELEDFVEGAIRHADKQPIRLATIEEGDEGEEGVGEEFDDDQGGKARQYDNDGEDGDDEMSFLNPPSRTERTSSQSSSRLPSLTESLSESFGALLARYPLCNAGYMDTTKKGQRRTKIPTTLEPDLLSVGDLTATTLEKLYRRQQADAVHNRYNHGGGSNGYNHVLGIHSTIMMPLQAAAVGLFACGANADTVDDSAVSHRSTPIQLTRSDSCSNSYRLIGPSSA